MKTKTVVGIAASTLVGLSLVAAPAVASGAEYLSTNVITVASPVSVVAVVDAPEAAMTLTAEPASAPALIGAWALTGVSLFVGASIAVAASTRRTRKAAS